MFGPWTSSKQSGLKPSLNVRLSRCGSIMNTEVCQPFAGTRGTNLEELVDPLFIVFQSYKNDLVFKWIVKYAICIHIVSFIISKTHLAIWKYLKYDIRWHFAQYVVLNTPAALSPWIRTVCFTATPFQSWTALCCIWQSHPQWLPIPLI